MQTYTPVPGMGGNPQQQVQSPINSAPYGQNQMYQGAPSLPPQPQPIQHQQQQQQMGMGMPSQQTGMSQNAIGRSSSMAIPSTQPMPLLDNC